VRSTSRRSRTSPRAAPTACSAQLRSTSWCVRSNTFARWPSQR